jgi:hypothetical protein
VFPIFCPRGGNDEMAAALQDLLGLWRGDDESSGYAQEGLALEIAGG